MDTHYSVDKGFHLKTHNKFSFRPHPHHSHANLSQVGHQFGEIKRLKWKTFQFILDYMWVLKDSRSKSVKIVYIIRMTHQKW